MYILPVNAKYASVNQFMGIRELWCLIPAENLIVSLSSPTFTQARNPPLSYVVHILCLCSTTD